MTIETSETPETPRPRRGFAAMDPARVREIASRGGHAAHRQGKAHVFTHDEAVRAGRIGGTSPRKPRSPPSPDRLTERQKKELRLLSEADQPRDDHNRNRIQNVLVRHGFAVLVSAQGVLPPIDLPTSTTDRDAVCRITDPGRRRVESLGT